MILSCGRFLPFSWPRDEVSRCRCSAVVAAGSRADCGVARAAFPRGSLAMAALPLRRSPGAVEARIGASRHRLGGMARPNEQVAALLQEYADLIAITGGEQFKARVYEKAARSVGGHPQDIAELDAGELRKIPNVGASIAEEIVAALSAVTGCTRCTYAGSLRRMRDTIGDVDILAAGKRSGPLMGAFVHLPLVGEVIARGEAKTNIRTREIAVRRKLKLSEYGLFDAASGDLIVSATEEEVYQRLGLPWIPPTLREDRGEIEAGGRGELPDLVSATDIRGDLHTHTDLTDGVATLEEMVQAAAQRGYAYYAVTDHAPNLFMQRMSDDKMRAQRAEMRALAGRYPKLRLLHGTELNIDPDGGVDWPAEFLAGFDVCVASVHSHFTQSRRDMTRRLVHACENPHVNESAGHVPPGLSEVGV